MINRSTKEVSNQLVRKLYKLMTVYKNVDDIIVGSLDPIVIWNFASFFLYIWLHHRLFFFEIEIKKRNRSFLSKIFSWYRIFLLCISMINLFVINFKFINDLPSIFLITIFVNLLYQISIMHAIEEEHKKKKN